MLKTQSPANTSLVESIPTGLEDLRGTPGIHYTEDVLVRLTKAARASIDLTAMYWTLIANPSSADESGFTPEQFQKLGADTGKALLDALTDAAKRGVRIRILQSPGFQGGQQESDTLQQQFPQAVSIHPIQMGDWYGGGGIMHQKLWVFDSTHIYLGSANMDWKSIMQVKEMGVVVENCAELGADATSYFEGWLAFSAIAKPSSVSIFDDHGGIYRRVPPWSPLVPVNQRAPSPLADLKYHTKFSEKAPLKTELNGKSAGMYLTGCPMELLGNGRTFDGDGLVSTINDARKSVSISVMDFGPISIYGRVQDSPDHPTSHFPVNTPVWWPDLFDALLKAVLTRKVYVRLLVSKWAHTSPLNEPFLHALQTAADGGRADSYLTAGQLEIKQFIVPGWDSTTGAHRKDPGHSRVNHSKYIVTDRRANIGTSNMTWDYFVSTAGSSFNTDHPDLVTTLQAAFDRDWASQYAFRLA
jgi:phospholipase D3/4